MRVVIDRTKDIPVLIRAKGKEVKWEIPRGADMKKIREMCIDVAPELGREGADSTPWYVAYGPHCRELTNWRNVCRWYDDTATGEPIRIHVCEGLVDRTQPIPVEFYTKDASSFYLREKSTKWIIPRNATMEKVRSMVSELVPCSGSNWHLKYGPKRDNTLSPLAKWEEAVSFFNDHGHMPHLEIHQRMGPITKPKWTQPPNEFEVALKWQRRMQTKWMGRPKIDYPKRSQDDAGKDEPPAKRRRTENGHVNGHTKKNHDGVEEEGPNSHTKNHRRRQPAGFSKTLKWITDFTENDRAGTAGETVLATFKRALAELGKQPDLQPEVHQEFKENLKKPFDQVELLAAFKVASTDLPGSKNLRELLRYAIGKLLQKWSSNKKATTAKKTRKEKGKGIVRTVLDEMFVPVDVPHEYHCTLSRRTSHAVLNNHILKAFPGLRARQFRLETETGHWIESAKDLVEVLDMCYDGRKAIRLTVVEQRSEFLRPDREDYLGREPSPPPVQVPKVPNKPKKKKMCSNKLPYIVLGFWSYYCEGVAHLEFKYNRKRYHKTLRKKRRRRRLRGKDEFIEVTPQDTMAEGNWRGALEEFVESDQVVRQSCKQDCQYETEGVGHTIRFLCTHTLRLDGFIHKAVAFGMSKKDSKQGAAKAILMSLDLIERDFMCAWELALGATSSTMSGDNVMTDFEKYKMVKTKIRWVQEMKEKYHSVSWAKSLLGKNRPLRKVYNDDGDDWMPPEVTRWRRGGMWQRGRNGKRPPGGGGRQAGDRPPRSRRNDLERLSSVGNALNAVKNALAGVQPNGYMYGKPRFSPGAGTSAQSAIQAANRLKAIVHAAAAAAAFGNSAVNTAAATAASTAAATQAANTLKQAAAAARAQVQGHRIHQLQRAAQQAAQAQAAHAQPVQAAQQAQAAIAAGAAASAAGKLPYHYASGAATNAAAAAAAAAQYLRPVAGVPASYIYPAGYPQMLGAPGTLPGQPVIMLQPTMPQG